MKRIITAIALFAVLFAGLATLGNGSVPLAQADRAPAGATCGSSWHGYGVHAYWAVFFPSGQYGDWQISWDEYCGNGGTVNAEMQQSTDYGVTWSDMGGMNDSVFTQQSGDNPEQRIHTYKNSTYGCLGGSHQYRMAVWANAQAGQLGGGWHSADTALVNCP